MLDDVDVKNSDYVGKGEIEEERMNDLLLSMRGVLNRSIRIQNLSSYVLGKVT